MNGASPGGGGDVNQLPVWCAGERLVMTSDVSLLETGALLNLNWIWRLIERETISQILKRDNCLIHLALLISVVSLIFVVSLGKFSKKLLILL